jgi:hypothetical protein
VPREELDSGYARTHYGPITNGWIAELIDQKSHQDGIIHDSRRYEMKTFSYGYGAALFKRFLPNKWRRSCDATKG